MRRVAGIIMMLIIIALQLSLIRGAINLESMNNMGEWHKEDYAIDESSGLPQPVNYTVNYSNPIENYNTDGDVPRGFDTVDYEGNAIAVDPNYTPVPDDWGWIKVNSNGESSYHYMSNNRVAMDVRSILKNGEAFVVAKNDTSYQPESNIYIYKYNFTTNSFQEIFEYSDPEYVNTRMDFIDLFEDRIVVSGHVVNTTGDSNVRDKWKAAIYCFNYSGRLLWRLVFDDIPTPSYAKAVRYENEIYAVVDYTNPTSGAKNTLIYRIDLDGTRTQIFNSTIEYGEDVTTASFKVRDIYGVKSTVGITKINSNKVYIFDPQTSAFMEFTVMYNISRINWQAARFESYYAFSYKNDSTNGVYLTNFAGFERKIYETTGNGGGGALGLTNSYVFVGFGLHPTNWGTGHVWTAEIIEYEVPELPSTTLNLLLSLLITILATIDKYRRKLPPKGETTIKL